MIYFNPSITQCLINHLEQNVCIHKTYLVICRHQKEAEDCFQDLNFYFKSANVQLFPDWETLPYDQFSPHQDIISQRLSILHALTQNTPMILVISVHTLLHFICPKTYLLKHAFCIRQQQIIPFEKFKQQLIEAQYQLVSQVEEHGQFSTKGSILDIFPMGSHAPIRIEWFDDEVESLRYFDPQTQISTEKINELQILPAKEYPLDEDAIREFRIRYREIVQGNPNHSVVYEQVSQGKPIQGLEYFLHLFFDSTQTFFDYFSKNIEIITLPNIQQWAERFWQETSIRYEQRRYDVSRPILDPHQILITVEALNNKLKSHANVSINTPSQITETISVHIERQKPKPFQLLKSWIEKHSQSSILIMASSLGRREVIHDLCKATGLYPQTFDQIKDFFESKAPLGLIYGPFREALYLDHHHTICITEQELFGETIVYQKPRRQSKLTPQDKFIKDLSELQIGMAVVHIDYGVGRYAGLQSFEHQGLKNEFLILKYANEDKVYVPITNLNLISKYSTGDSEHAPLHKLGNDTWQKEKKKASEKIYDMAVELLETQALRQAKQGFKCELEHQDYERFASSFRFTETEDQKNTIEAIIKDLRSPQPMDRLVCGDVGFGKTEVAMRAAFVMVQNHRQVCVLVPTTLLAKQHFETFQERFADFPITVELISRFRTKKESDKVLENLKKGTVDILIGTHKLLQQDVDFKNLGLLIIDEEHRFGVKQKEYLKKMKHQADILSLTATPIPRTLNMAMHGMRDISIISTPPAKRLSIKTFWNEKKPALIREAILREILRGGQVYYLQNDIDHIEKITKELQDLVPEAKIDFAHGQMNERRLEQIMADFYHQKFNVLVCTTIIETGIDIPTANTIIMERADKLGLAQMHQLRGRVGRSHHQAYAYLLTPNEKALSSDAKKRLEAIISLEDLGAGFSLAMHDMEIRGAGEFLGEEQSGNMQAMGYSLYMEMLEQAVEDIKAGRVPQLDQIKQNQCEVDLKISSIIPDDYIGDVNQRLIFYKRFSHAQTAQELHDLQVELIDRFGLLPEPIKNLIAITQLKLHAMTLGVKRIILNQTNGVIEFHPNPKIDPMKMIQLIQQEFQTYKLNPQQHLLFVMPELKSQEKIDWIANLLNRLQ